MDGGGRVVAAVFSWLYVTAERARFDLRYLSSSSFRALAAMGDVLVDAGRPNRPTGEQVAQRVDGFLASFDSYAKSTIRLSLFVLAYYPLLSLHAPLATMDPACAWPTCASASSTEVGERRLVGSCCAACASDLIYSASQMVYLGYYEDPRAGAACRYVPFSQRPEAADAVGHAGAAARLPRIRATCADGDIDGRRRHRRQRCRRRTLAYELAARGREVLVLERGRHVDPSQFTEDEATQYSALYADGALELSTDFRFAVTQGMCVGGSTVVNNAVLLRHPRRGARALGRSRGPRRRPRRRPPAGLLRTPAPLVAGARAGRPSG